MPLPINSRLLFVGLLLSLVMMVFVFFVGRNTDGFVKELVSGQPIGSVRINLSCYKSTFPHGSKLVRTAETISRADGSFSFLPSDIRDCSHLSSASHKEGFRDAADLRHSTIKVELVISAAVPRNLYMVRDTEVSKLELEGLYNQSTGSWFFPADYKPTQDEIALVEYTRVNIPFFESIRIASTAEQVSWVQERYCERLSALWLKVQSKEYQTHLQRSSNIVSPSDVLAYCQKTPFEKQNQSKSDPR